MDVIPEFFPDSFGGWFTTCRVQVKWTSTLSHVLRMLFLKHNDMVILSKEDDILVQELRKFEYSLQSLLQSIWPCTCDLRWIWQPILCVTLEAEKLRERSFELIGQYISQYLQSWRKLASKASFPPLLF